MQHGDWLSRHPLGNKICIQLGNTAQVGSGVPVPYLPQAGLRVMAFSVAEKQYQAILDVVLDGPMVGRWTEENKHFLSLIDKGLVEKFVRTMEPFLTEESNEVGKSFRREKKMAVSP